MRRAAIWAGVVALAAVAAGSARWPVAPSRVAASLNAAPGARLRLTWSTPEAVTFSALPWPSLRIVEAKLEDASAANVVSAPDAEVDLSPIELVLGRVAPTHLTLFAPTITLDLDRPPSGGRLGASDALTAIRGFSPPDSVSLTDGLVRVTGRRQGFDTVIESVRGRLDGLSLTSRFSVDLSAVWRGAPLVVSGSLDEPQRAARGMASALNVAVASALGDLAFRGALTVGATPGAAGELSISSHTLGEAVRLFGFTPSLRLGAADVAISGSVKATPGDVVFDDATITAGGQTLQGALRFMRNGGRLAVSGSLDSAHLSTPPSPGRLEPFAADGGWSRSVLLAAPLSDFDLDLRLSTDRLDVYRVGLDNVAVSALLRDGALTVSLIDATAYGGHVKGELRFACDNGALRVGARGSLTGADFGAAVSDLGWPHLTGKGAAEFAIETEGPSPADLIAGLSGDASFALEDGAISGINLEEALRRGQRRPIDVTKDMRSGGTTFDRASVSLLIGGGVAHVLNGALVAQGLSADLQGAVDLVGQSWKLRVNAAQAAPAGATPPDAPHLSLDISGPWSNPSIRPVDETDSEKPNATSTP